MSSGHTLAYVLDAYLKLISNESCQNREEEADHMHQALSAIQEQLDQLTTHLKSVIPNDEPFGNAHANWGFPGLTRSELIEAAESVKEMIAERGGDSIATDDEKRIVDYVRRLTHLRTSTAAQLWGNAAVAVPAYMLTLDALRRALEPALKVDPKAEAAQALKRATTQLRALEARLKDLDPRSQQLAGMVERIERAHNAADQLPTDLDSLSEARETVAGVLRDTEKDRARVLAARENADELDKSLTEISTEAKAVLARCESAYSAATSVGLAAAFSERSRSLAGSMWVWVAGLVVSLGTGAFFGSQQLHSLADLVKTPSATTGAIATSLLLSLLSVGAPVWFAWMATKQVGQRFRLSEDYAFKAAVSRAYEGYRREAARVDPTMEARLLSSALTRLDELPLRLVETTSHGSPMHEFAASDVVKDALKSVPGFAEAVKALASKGLDALKPTKASLDGSGALVEKP